MFASEDAYFINLKGALEHRLNQLAGLDRALKRSLERGIEDLPEHPDNCIANIRHIVDRSLELIWACELDRKKLPSEWFAMWDHNEERSHKAWNGQFPASRGHQVGLLRFMTGTERSRPVAKYVTRNTYSLLAAAQGFGDFGQHMDGMSVHPGVAFAAMSVCIETAGTLQRELP